MTRRTFLRSMVVVPAGLALSGGVARAFSTYTEYGQIRVELRSGPHLVATRYVTLTDRYQTYSMNLTAQEVARIDRWDRISFCFQGGPAVLLGAELESPEPVTLHIRGKIYDH